MKIEESKNEITREEVMTRDEVVKEMRKVLENISKEIYDWKEKVEKSNIGNEIKVCLFRAMKKELLNNYKIQNSKLSKLQYEFELKVLKGIWE